MKHFFVLILSIALSTNLAFAQNDVAEKLIETYPYYASKLRASEIKDKYKMIQKSMTLKQVTHLLGEPDEIRHLYEPKILKPKQIGYRYWVFNPGKNR